MRSAVLSCARCGADVKDCPCPKPSRRRRDKRVPDDDARHGQTALYPSRAMPRVSGADYDPPPMEAEDRRFGGPGRVVVVPGLEVRTNGT